MTLLYSLFMNIEEKLMYYMVYHSRFLIVT